MVTLTFTENKDYNNRIVSVGDYDIWNCIKEYEDETELELVAMNRRNGRTKSNCSTGNSVSLCLDICNIIYSSVKGEYCIHIF